MLPSDKSIYLLIEGQSIFSISRLKYINNTVMSVIKLFERFILLHISIYEIMFTTNNFKLTLK